MKAIILISGGFDSAVAAYLIKKNKIKLIGLHFSIEPFSGDEPEQKSIKIAKKLGFEKLYIIKAGEKFAEIANKCNKRFYFVLTKRFMLMTAEKIAKKEKAKYLVTGESIGQVSSQTLENLIVIEKAAKIQLLRPLITYDKNEIIELAKEIGTYDISKGPEVCDILGPKNPATKAKLDLILKEEKRLDLKNMIDDAVKTIIIKQ